MIIYITNFLADLATAHPLCTCRKFTKAQSTMSRLADCLPEKHQGTLIIIFDIYDGKHLRYNVELEL